MGTFNGAHETSKPAKCSLSLLAQPIFQLLFSLALTESLGCAEAVIPRPGAAEDEPGELPLFVDTESLWSRGQDGTVCFIAEGGGAVSSATVGSCLGAPLEHSVGESQIRVEPCSPNEYQNWQVVGDTLLSGDRCLSASLEKGRGGSRAVLTECNGSRAQSWLLNAVDSGLQLRNEETGLCLHDPGSDSARSEEVQLRPCEADPAQTWKLPNTRISPEHQRAIRDAVANSWAAVTQMQFRFWRQCTDNLNPETTIAIQSRHGEGEASGRESNGRRMITLDLTSETKPAELRDTIVHEMGHVLGFAHEQGRLDNRFSEYCDIFQDGSWGAEPNHPKDWSKTTTLGVFDPTSVMSYCQYGGVKANLSRNDIENAQRYLGERSFRRALWSSRSARRFAKKVAEGEVALTLSPGERWYSNDRIVALGMESDGQLTVRRTDLPNFSPLWSSGVKASAPIAEFGSDGILRVRSRATTVWQSTIESHPMATLSVQHNGDVVIKDSTGRICWSTQTAHRDELEGAVGLTPGGSLAAAAYKDTASGRFRLEMQLDGDLVVSDRWKSARIWSSNSAGLGARAAKMMLDGTLVLLDAVGERVWTASYSGRPSAFLALQEDGNLVVYEPAKYLVWSAGENRYEEVEEPFEATFDDNPVMLRSGARLSSGSSIWGPSGRSKLVMETDGNLALYVSPSGGNEATRWTVKWQTGTRASDQAFAVLDRDGAIRVYSGAHKILYDSGTSNYLNTYLSFNDTGRIMLFRMVSVGASRIGFQ
ncbi:MAG TPA: ricin-type beta-trefoil lectin domain protein [Polyangiaceae bacterium]|nr:ricin-type beta-trefoil lectin domain protein [Polyangiaceae bacterium]